MPPRRATTTFLVLALAAGSVAAENDVFQEYGLDRRSWGDAFVHSLADGVLHAPSVPARLKGVPPAQRSAVVQALGAAAKAYFGKSSWKRSSAELTCCYEGRLDLPARA